MIPSMIAEYEAYMCRTVLIYRFTSKVLKDRQTDRWTDRKGDYYRAPSFSMHGPIKDNDSKYSSCHRGDYYSFCLFKRCNYL